MEKKSKGDIMLENTKLHQYLKRMEQNVLNCLEQIQQLQKRYEILHEKQEEKVELQNQELEQIKKEQTIQQEKLDLLVKRTIQFDVMNTEMLLLQPTVKRKILLLGFYGANNTGDELMLQALLKEFNSYKDKCEITVMIADNLEYELNLFGQVHFIHYPKTPSDTSIIMNYFDDIVVGGGALIDDACYLENNLDNVSNLLIDLGLHAIHKEKGIYLVGLSTSNQIQHKEYITKLNEIIKKANYVSIRDPYSLQTLREAGIETSSIHLVEDLAYVLPTVLSPKREENKLTIGMVLINYIDDETFSTIIEGVEEFLESIDLEKQKEIHLIPFYDYCHFDITQYEKRAKAISTKVNIVIEPYTSDCFELCKQFSNCNMMVCMRYHSSLLALKMGMNCVHLVYDVHRHYSNKMKYLLEQYEAENDQMSVKKIHKEDLVSLLKNAYVNHQNKLGLQENVTRQIEEKAKKQIEELFSIIFSG